MRTSKRDRIITGALELAHRDGFDALTFDALAEHVGLTRGGVIYHFRTKTELLEGIAVAFQERWRAEALEALGKPAVEEDFANLQALEELTGVQAPVQLSALRDKAERFTQVVPREDTAQVVVTVPGSAP